MKKLITAVFTLGCLFAQIVTASADLHEGLVSYWPFETTDGVTTPDLAHTNQLNLAGGPALVPGTNGNAFPLNGTSQYLTLTHPSFNPINGLPVVNSARYTVAMWVKAPPGSGTKYLFTHGLSTSTTGPLVYFRSTTAAGGKVEIFLRNTANTVFVNDIRSTNVVFDNTWHHLAWVDDNGAAKLYIDGVLDGANYNYSPGTVGAYGCNTTTIGALVRATTSGFFNGTVDEAAVWERALSQSEIDQVRTNGIPTPVPQTFAPVFTLQPVGSTNQMGDRGLFSASAMGTHPLNFQWFKDGNPILDATNTTLILTDLTAATTNVYRVDVGNANGTNFSDTVILVALADPVSNIPNGLISSWPFNTVDANTNTPDLYSGFNMALAATNPAATFDASSLVPGQFGNALSFVGTNGNAGQYTKRVGGSPIYHNTSYSVSLWVKGNGTTQPSTARVFAEGSLTNNNSIFTIATDAPGTTNGPSGVASVLIRTSGNIALVNGRNSTKVAFDGNWHHLVWVDENGKAQLFVDGVVDESDFNYTRSNFTLQTTAVGGLQRAAVGNFFNGSIDDVAVWNRRLTYTEIQEIKNLGVPAPVGVVPPTITEQPVNKTNNIFAGDTVSFSALAAGTAPLSYHWNKNGSPIDGVANPSALTNLLVLTNVQTSDSGNYFVTVTNGGGTTNSITVQLTVTPYTPTTNGTVLKLDFNDVTFPETHPDFSAMTLLASGTNFNGVKVTIAPIGTTTLADRNRRNEGSFFQMSNNPPALTQAELYTDFIFSSDIVNAGSGMSILIERLAPNTQYGLTVWSWDHDNSTRTSDWTETASGSSVPIITGYTFNGPTPITHDFDATFGALLTSSSTGKLQIEGRKAIATSVSVFVNALRLVANPIMRIANAELINGNLRITIETQYPGQPITIQEKTDLHLGWSTPASGGIIETHGPIVIAEFPASANQSFYRVTSP